MTYYSLFQSPTESMLPFVFLYHELVGHNHVVFSEGSIWLRIWLWFSVPHGVNPCPISWQFILQTHTPHVPDVPYYVRCRFSNSCAWTKRDDNMIPVIVKVSRHVLFFFIFIDTSLSSGQENEGVMRGRKLYVESFETGIRVKTLG